MYRAKERLHLTRDGKVCKPGDPKSARLLVAEGGELSDQEAEHYGLTGTKHAPADDVLSLDSPPAPTGQVVSTVPPADNPSGFPTSLQFGGAKPTENPPSAPSQPELPSAPAAPAPVAETAPPAPVGESDLPADIPQRDLLIAGGMSQLADVIVATKEQLIAIDQIGAARADEIIAYCEALRQHQS